MDENLIKLATSLEQSRKLAMILSPEIADMYWWNSGKEYCLCLMDDGYFSEEEHHIRAWSLSALLNVLPDKICLNNETYYLDCNKKEVKYLGPVTHNGQKSIVSASDNLLDGCYKMIRTLHELKLL